MWFGTLPILLMMVRYLCVLGPCRVNNHTTATRQATILCPLWTCPKPCLVRYICRHDKHIPIIIPPSKPQHDHRVDDHPEVCPVDSWTYQVRRRR